MIKFLKLVFAVILVAALTISPIAHSYFFERLENIIECSEESDSEFLMIVFDISDPYDARDADYVMRDLDSVFRKAKKSTKILVLQLTENEQNSPIQIFSGTIIPDLNKLPFYLRIVASDDVKKEITERNNYTLGLVNSHVEQILRSTSLKTSPIIESLINITKSYEFQNTKNIKIILYSDMRQNTNTLKLLRYNKENNKIDLSKLNYSKVSFKGALVEVRYIKRSSLEDNKFEEQIRHFWNSWFQYSDGKIQWR